jgi:hypothetical protein
MWDPAAPALPPCDDTVATGPSRASRASRIAPVARAAILWVAAAATGPLWIAPVGLWALLQRRARGRLGLSVLWPVMASAADAYARAWIHDPEGHAASPERASRRLDRFLAHANAPRLWRVRALLVAMELAPLCVGSGRFSRLDAVRARRFLEEHVERPGAPLAILRPGRQLVRMGWYADPGVGREIGYLASEERRRPRPRRDRRHALAADVRLEGVA